MTFDTSFDRLMGNEGSYTPGIGDPGGETQWGIAKAFYPHLDIKALTRDQAKDIYRRDFWLAGKMDQYADAIAFQVFDTAVNHGIQTAIRLLQRAVQVADDGWVGPTTVAAVKAIPVPRVLMRYVAARLRFWAQLTTFQRFGAGWANRAATDLEYAAGDS